MIFALDFTLLSFLGYYSTLGKNSTIGLRCPEENWLVMIVQIWSENTIQKDLLTM